MNLPDSEKQKSPEQQEAVAFDAANPEQGTAEQPPALVTARPTDAAPNLDSLFQQALSQVEKNPETALQNISLVLDQQPGDLDALKLKQRIAQELSVRSIIATAERQLQELKLLQPSGDNAYESYLALADRLSADDERVRRGFTRIAAACHSQAESFFEQRHLEKAQEYVDLGLSVRNDYPPLLNLRIRIKEQKDALQRKNKLARLEQQRREQQRRMEKKGQQEAQKHQLEQRTDASEQQQQAQAQAQNNAESMPAQQQTEQSKREKIEVLLASAKGYLDSDELSLTNVFSAHQDDEQLRTLDLNDPEVRKLQKELIDAYITLAARENGDDLFESALSSLEQGVQLSPRDRKKLQIRSRLSRY